MAENPDRIVEWYCPHCERVKFMGSPDYVADMKPVADMEGATIRSCSECYATSWKREKQPAAAVTGQQPKGE